MRGKLSKAMTRASIDLERMKSRSRIMYTMHIRADHETERGCDWSFSVRTLFSHSLDKDRPAHRDALSLHPPLLPLRNPDSLLNADDLHHVSPLRTPVHGEELHL